MRIIPIFVAALYFLASTPALAADISMAPPQERLDTSKTLMISGDIQRGDTEELINLMMSLPEDNLPISTLLLGPSRGGNIEEAMSIGFLARTLKWKVIVFDQCYSACSLIAVSSVYRVFAGEMGLHRPYYDPAFYGEADPFYIEQWHNQINSKVQSFLEEAYVPNSIIEKMMSVNSREMWTLSATDAEKVLSNFPPYFEELILAQCDGMPITIPEFGMNAECLDSELRQMQRQAFINFLTAVSQGDF